MSEPTAHVVEVKLDDATPPCPLTYFSEAALPVGARVEVPVLSWTETGTVVRLGSPYNGAIRKVIRRLVEPSATHVLIEADGDVWLLSNPSVPDDAHYTRDAHARITAEFYCLAATNSRAGIQPSADDEWVSDGSFSLDRATLMGISAARR